MQFYQVQFGDDAPVIGSGLRYVFAVEGPVWTQLLTPRLESARVPRSKWEGLRKIEIELEGDQHRRRYLRKIMRKNRQWRPRTAVVKRAEQAVAS